MLRDQLMAKDRETQELQSQIASLKKQLDQFLNMAMKSDSGDENMGPLQMKIE